MTDIQERLISWYRKSKRSLPWRETQDPYLIWLSEIILQQTRVAQGVDYYHKFVKAYPKIEMLAAASEQEVLKMWQGLGYYSRARNLRNTAIHVSEELGGEFPKTYKEVLKLKGVGPYTAAAIVSFAYRIPKAVVDGNVNRVLSRLFDINTPVDSTLGKKQLQEIADELISQEHPDLFNQGIMELGAMVCTPTKPDCLQCPLSHHCQSRMNNTIAERPVKLPKRKAKSRPMHYLVIDDGGALIMKERDTKDIWAGLWDFPVIESSKPLSREEISTYLKAEFNLRDIRVTETPIKTYKHILTHQHIQAHFWLIEAENVETDKSVYLSIAKNRLSEMAVPRLIHKFLVDSSFID